MALCNPSLMSETPYMGLFVSKYNYITQIVKIIRLAFELITVKLLVLT